MTKIWIIVMLCLVLVGCREGEDIAIETNEIQEYFAEDLFDIQPFDSLTIQAGPEEVLVIEYDTGDIYYQGRLIVTDKELVNAFKHLFGNLTCPHCGKNMYEDMTFEPEYKIKVEEKDVLIHVTFDRELLETWLKTKADKKILVEIEMNEK